MAMDIGWDTFPGLREDGVDLTIEDAGIGPDSIELVLRLSPHLAWQKALIGYDAQGNEKGRVKTFDNAKGPEAMTLRYDELDRVELAKAKGFGILTGMYQLRSFEDVRGKRVTFYWHKD